MVLLILSSTIFIEYMLPECFLAYFKITLPLLNLSFEIIAIHDLLISDRSDDFHSSLAFLICKGGRKFTMHLSPANFKLKTLPAMIMHLLVLYTVYREKQRQEVCKEKTFC